jgi:hypothetical protein
MTSIAFPTAGLKLLGTLDRLGGADQRTLAPSAYESLLRKPAIALATTMDTHLAHFAPEYRADPRRIGTMPGQVFRHDRHGLARRTEVAIDFTRRRFAPGTAASFGVRIGATGIDVAAGMWQPEAQAAARWRSWLLSHHQLLENAMSGEVLRRVGPPQALIGDHVRVLNVGNDRSCLDRLLMSRELWWVVRLAPGLLTSSGLDRVVAGYFRVLAPCVRILSGAMGGGTGGVR